MKNPGQPQESGQPGQPSNLVARVKLRRGHAPGDLENLADWMDTRFKGPFGTRFGLDTILGLVPGFGDMLTIILAAFIVVKAAWHGYPLPILARMFLNFLIDTSFTVVPILGDIADYFFKSNTRNIDLMQAYQLDPEKTKRRSIMYVISVTILLFVIVVAASITAVAVAWYLIVVLYNYVSGWLAG